MCSATLTRIFYTLCMLGMIALTTTSVITPGIEFNFAKGWRNFHSEGVANSALPASTGLFPASCVPIGNVTKAEFDYCEKWIKEKPVWEKVVAACMIVGLASEVMGLIMAILTYFTCCDERAANAMLPALALIATIVIVVAVTLYGIKNEKAIGVEGFNEDINRNVENIENVIKGSSLGYSFYMAVFASIIGIVASVFGGTLVSFYKPT